VALALFGSSAAASAQSRVVFTVDVESNDAFGLPAQVDASCEGVPCGLIAISRLLEERGWAGTFFLDVYEHTRWGNDALKRIALRLQAAGHDVELHTHPQWAFDGRRNAMYQYSLDEQTAIVRDGVERLESWTGEPVVAHRAGAYTADERTLLALARNGVPIDSSLFWRYPECRLDPLGLARNLPSRYRGVAEIPVTVYERADRPSIGATLLPAAAVVRKLDPNWLSGVEEMHVAFEAVVAADVPVIVVFLHSFSFMSGEVAHPRLDGGALAIFRAMLDEVARRGLTTTTMRELSKDDATALAAARNDVVPQVPVRVDAVHYVWRLVRTSSRVAQATGLACVALALACTLAIRRRAPRMDQR
jgi:hypothetical protein